jgi:hypothetical protein
MRIVLRQIEGELLPDDCLFEKWILCAFDAFAFSTAATIS